MDLHVKNTDSNFASRTRAQKVHSLSVIVPVYNEAAVLPQFQRRLAAVLADITSRWEVLYVDDGSTDDTQSILSKFQAANPCNIGVIRFSRNFGKEQAMTAGLARARGDAAIVIDADLQDPPEVIPTMVEAWQRGVDVVNMRRESRAGENWFKRFTAYAFYRSINRVSDVPIPNDVGDFRLFSRAALDALNQLPERNRFMKGLFAWIGYPQVTISYHRDARHAGRTKWRYWKLWNFAIEGITSFSTVPLKLATFAGLLSATCAFLYATFVAIKTVLIGDPVPGFPTLIVVVLFFAGIQLIALGVLGEYVGRIYIESKQRPLYLVEDYRPARNVGELRADSPLSIAR